MGELEPFEFQHEGSRLLGRIARPHAPGPHPAVLVMHSAQGLGPVSINAARRLAAEGYVALAADMYGDGAFHATDGEAMGVCIGPLLSRPDFMRARIVAWYEQLKAEADVDPQRVGAIGFCFGGQCVLELARSGADARAVVSYHGLLTTHRPAEAGQVRPLVSIYTGRLDPYAPRQDVENFRAEMIAADARWNLTEFGNSYHGFTDPDAGILPMPGVVHDPLAAELSWRGTLALFDQLLGPNAAA